MYFLTLSRALFWFYKNKTFTAKMKTKYEVCKTAEATEETVLHCNWEKCIAMCG
jgi:hypothetical protein